MGNAPLDNLWKGKIVCMVENRERIDSVVTEVIRKLRKTFKLQLFMVWCIGECYRTFGGPKHYSLLNLSSKSCIFQQ